MPRENLQRFDFKDILGPLRQQTSAEDQNLVKDIAQAETPKFPESPITLTCDVSFQETNQREDFGQIQKDEKMIPCENLAEEKEEEKGLEQVNTDQSLKHEDKSERNESSYSVVLQPSSFTPCETIESAISPVEK